MEFPNGHGGLDIFRIGSVAEVAAGVAEVQRYVAARKAAAKKEVRHAS